MNTSQMQVNKPPNSRIKVLAGASVVKYPTIFTHDSRYLLVASGREVKVLSTESGECLKQLKSHSGIVISIQINPRNHLQALTCSEDGIVIQWDYQDGIFLRKFDLGLQMAVAAFYAPSANGTWYVTVRQKGEDFHHLLSVKTEQKDIIKKFVLKPVLPHHNCVAFGVKGEFVSGIYNNELRLVHLGSNSFKIHKTGTRKLTCVTCHPNDCIVATGDDSGRILIWSGALDSNRPIRSVYHWHTLPVADLVFSAEGTYLYSGGGESVLVKWKLGTENRHFLPRMGMPITNLMSSPDNSYVAVSHVDNAIHLVSSQNRIVNIYQGLTLGFQHRTHNENSWNLPTGILYDPRSKAIVMNGKPGHLQFYLLREDKQLFNLDIVGQNYMSQERNQSIINVDVDKAAIDDQGLWLATVEHREDGEKKPEILKFWNFNLTSQSFVLNTSVYLPHSKTINALKFQPFSQLHNEQCNLLAVTTSDDKRFKVWTSVNIDEASSEKVSWCCESMGYYKDLPAKDACFSQDGSLLAVTFSHVVTLWIPDTNVFKASICHPRIHDIIHKVAFGKETCAHLIVCSTAHNLIVWNVLTLTVAWNISLDIQHLVCDPKSNVMAVFSKDQNLFVFEPNNPKPLYIHMSTTQKPVVAGIFLPNSALLEVKKPHPQLTWQQHSQLYFMDQDQMLLTVADEDEDEADSENSIKVAKIEDSHLTNLFQMSLIKDKKSDVDIHKESIYAKEIKEVPSHVVLSLNKLCSSFLSSLLIRKEHKHATSEF